jgi:hypothetical protein
MPLARAAAVCASLGGKLGFQVSRSVAFMMRGRGSYRFSGGVVLTRATTPQFGHTLKMTASTHDAQNVHS